MNKFAIITGASRGIGRDVAKYFAGQHYNLALIARSEDKLISLRQACLALNDQLEISCHVMDVADTEKVYQSVKSIVDQAGRVDVLFNSAGIAEQGTSEISIDSFERMQAVNMNGTFAAIKGVIEKMKQQKDGYIMNLASLSGHRAKHHLGAYAASKFAMVGFAQALYKELLSYNVRVTSICPGPIDTDMTKGMGIANDEKIQLTDIIHTVEFLLKLTPGAMIENINIDCRAWMEAFGKY